MSRPTQTEVAEDHRLSELAEKSQYELDRWRWHMCADPDGPKYTQEIWAKAVGVSKGTISKSVNAWAGALAAANSLFPTGNKERGHGKKTTPRVEAVTAAVEAGQTLDDPTPEQHKRASGIARHGERKNTAIEAIAAEWGKSPTTVRTGDKRAGWDDRRRDVMAMADRLVEKEGLDWEVACRQAAKITHDAEAKKKDLQRQAKRNQAEQASRASWVLEIVNIAKTMADAGERGKKNLDGDPRAIQWDDDTTAMLTQEIDRAQALIDWLRFLPVVDEITPEMIIGGGR